MQNCAYLFSDLISQNEFIFGSFVVLLLLSWVLFGNVEGRVEHILVGIIVGAASLNLLERLFFGCVSDPFNFFGFFYFNVWDVAITVGVLTLFVKIGIKPLMLRK